jgi:hypothetical protein
MVQFPYSFFEGEGEALQPPRRCPYLIAHCWFVPASEPDSLSGSSAVF